MSNQIPTERLTLTWPQGVAETEETRDAFNEDSTNKILAFANELRSKGERAWFEIWYAGFPGRPDTSSEDFDAVEVDEAGVITTLPPYSELVG